MILSKRNSLDENEILQQNEMEDEESQEVLINFRSDEYIQQYMKDNMEEILNEENNPNHVNIKQILIFDFQADLKGSDDSPFVLKDFVFDKKRPLGVFILSVLNYIQQNTDIYLIDDEYDFNNWRIQLVLFQRDTQNFQIINRNSKLQNNPNVFKQDYLLVDIKDQKQVNTVIDGSVIIMRRQITQYIQNQQKFGQIQNNGKIQNDDFQAYQNQIYCQKDSEQEKDSFSSNLMQDFKSKKKSQSSYISEDESMESQDDLSIQSNKEIQISAIQQNQNKILQQNENEAFQQIQSKNQESQNSKDFSQISQDFSNYRKYEFLQYDRNKIGEKIVISKILADETNKIFKPIQIYQSLEEIQQKIIDKLNGLFPQNMKTFRYKYQLTGKYVYIKCQSCSKFCFWLKNQDDKDMSQFCEDQGNKKSLKIKDQFQNSLSLFPFRKIKLFHDVEHHEIDLLISNLYQ